MKRRGTEVRPLYKSTPLALKGRHSGASIRCAQRIEEGFGHLGNGVAAMAGVAFRAMNGVTFNINATRQSMAKTNDLFNAEARDYSAAEKMTAFMVPLDGCSGQMTRGGEGGACLKRQIRASLFRESSF